MPGNFTQASFEYDLNDILPVLFTQGSCSLHPNGAVWKMPNGSLNHHLSTSRYLPFPFCHGERIGLHPEPFIQKQQQAYKNEIHRSSTMIVPTFISKQIQLSMISSLAKAKKTGLSLSLAWDFFMDTDGIPISFSIYPGNRNEQLTMIPLEEKMLSSFDMSKFIVCTDAGLSSASNRVFNTYE
mgnify:CR=1 FL=1